MSVLLKQVLALGAKSEAAAWITAEQNVLSGLSQLARNEFVKVTSHFGMNKQGSKQLWEQLDKSAVSVFPQLTVSETLELIDGFGESPDTYELSEDLDERLTLSWEKLGAIALQRLQEADPYVMSNLMKEIDVGLPEGLAWRADQAADEFDVRTLRDNCVIQAVGDSVIKSAEEREDFIQKKALKYLQENPESEIFDLIGSK